jgi:hypothetical protein
MGHSVKFAYKNLLAEILEPKCEETNSEFDKGEYMQLCKIRLSFRVRKAPTQLNPPFLQSSLEQSNHVT